MSIGVLEQHSGVGRSPATVDIATEALVFQKLDATHYNTPHSELGKVPVVKFYGVTTTGSSVLCHVTGFQPYFYIALETTSLSPSQCEMFKSALNSHGAVAKAASDNGATIAITDVVLVQRQSLWNYQFGQQSYFLLVHTSIPQVISACRRTLESGLHVRDISDRAFVCQTFESNVPFELRVMIDTGVTGGCWIEIPAGAARARESPESTCQIEVEVPASALVPRVTGDEWIKIAPLRILSFDIECASRKNHFPDAQLDPVIQIANYVQVYGQSGPLVKNVFTLKTCAPIAGAEVHSFENEAEMLVAWRDFLQAVDPDVLTGYNIINFDLPYLIDRAGVLGARRMLFLGRTNVPVKMKDARFTSKAFGTRDNKEITMEGRIQFDMLPAILKEYKLRSYSLNAVSAEFLKQSKEDVHYSIITDLQNGTPETRRRLAVYCLKDAMLPILLMEKLMFLVNYIEMARVTGVPLGYLLTRGQQIKVVSQLLRKARARGIVAPTLAKKPSTDQTYEGATVFDPVRGYYTQPIATLDFSSLYPSIMIAHNLCYTTLVPGERIGDVAKDNYVKTPTGHYFVKDSVIKGLLPEVLIELLEARKKAKKDLKMATDPLTKAVLNGRQLALKISANSVYGFTGATVGQLPCLPISASVTSFGRDMIENTKDLVEKTYPGSQVIYGDTDSVMVNFHVDSVAESMRLGTEAAIAISSHFLKPIKLEFEKVYYPYLLMNKKRYAGLYWTDPNMWSKLDAKGIETVRRDNCPLVKTVVETVLHMVLVKKDKDEAVEYVKGVISDLLCARMDLSQLVISKALNGSSEDYKNKQAHVELAKRMKERDPGNAPSSGDRVQYVIIRGAKGAPAYERAEDPSYVLEHGLQIDTQYYLENQLKAPLTRLFEPIMGDANSVLTGEHTRTVKVQTAPATSALMKFVVKKKHCLGCKVVLKSNAVVCQHCEPNLGEIYMEHLAGVRMHEELHSRLWTECQRCQGSLHQDVICSNRDCPIFYRRKKVQKDLEAAQVKLSRFEM